jgi:hypothetical protein
LLFLFFGYLLLSVLLTKINLGPQKSNNNGAVINTITAIKKTNNQTNTQSINNNNIMTARSNRALFGKEEYTLRNTCGRDDDIDEDNERSTG